VCVCIPSAVRTLCPNELMRRKKKAVHATESFTHTQRKVLCTSAHIAQDYKTRLKEQLHFVRHHVFLCVYVKRQEEANAFR